MPYHQIRSSNEVLKAFASGKAMTKNSLSTDGHTLSLFGNVIAYRPAKGYGVCVTLAGWNTVSTRQCLNCLPGVRAWSEKGKPMINGIPVTDNEVITVRCAGYSKPKGPRGALWITTTKWIATDAWRGYEEPLYAVAGANDTGGWGDSPCPSDVAAKEIKQAIIALKAAGVPYRRVTGSTSNVFCGHHYLVVQPVDVEKGRAAVLPLVEGTRLLYVV